MDNSIIFFNSSLTFDHLILKLNHGPLIQHCTFDITSIEHLKQCILTELKCRTSWVFSLNFFFHYEVFIFKFPQTLKELIDASKEGKFSTISMS